MSRGFFSLILALILPLSLFAQSETALEGSSSLTESAALFREARSYIRDLSPREEGSRQESDVLLYIEEEAARMGFRTEYRALDGREDRHSFSTDLIIRVPGRSENTLILASPLDSYGDDAGRELNPALALAFLNIWKRQTPPVSLLFLFTSADSIDRDFLGSASFLAHYSPAGESALLYLMMDRDSQAPEIRGCTAGRNAPGWYMELLHGGLEESGIPGAVDSPSILVARSGLRVDELPLGEYLNRDIPAAALVSSGFPGPEMDGQVEQWLRFLTGLCLSLEEDFNEDWGSNYVYLSWNKRVFAFLSERVVLLAVLGIISIALLLLIFQQRKIHLNFKRFKGRFWAVPLIVYLIFTFFMISTLFLEDLMVLADNPELWQLQPMYFLILKALFAMFLSALFINLLRGLPFPRNPHFYSYMAFAAGLVNVCIVLVMNISLSPVLLLNQLIIFLFIAGRRLGTKRFFLYLSIIPQLLLLSYLFSRDYPMVIRFFLLSRVRGNWFMTLFSLPVICLGLALYQYHHHYERSRQEMRTAIMTLLQGAVVVMMVVFAFQLSPRSEFGGSRISLEEVMDMNRGIRDLEISSNRNLGGIYLNDGDRRLPLPAEESKFSLQGEADESLLDLKWETREFLDRRSITLLIHPADEADEITLEAVSDERLVLYDSIYPYELSPDQKKVRVFIGVHPPRPLQVPLIFSRDSRPELKIRIIRDDSEADSLLILPKNGDTVVDAQRIIERSLSFEELKNSSPEEKDGES